MTDSFGAVLRKFRREAGLSQRELAERIDRDFSYISKLENDRLPPPAADTVVMICRALEVNPEGLLALIGKIPSEVHQTVSTSKAAQEFLREVQKMGLRDEEWQTMMESLKNLRDDSR